MVILLNPNKGKGQRYAGLSTDTKPEDGVINGAMFLEMDTGDNYIFDADSQEWLSTDLPFSRYQQIND